MNLSSVVILHLFLVLLHVEADTTGRPENLNFASSMAVVIGVLGIMFSSVVSCLLLAYLKFCQRRESADRRSPPQNNTGLIISPSSRIFSGIDRTVVESLPFFRFSSLTGSVEGLECVVCLSKFEDIDVLRLLPKCKHAFHINCIDHWLEKHSSCPLCRHKVSYEDLDLISCSNSMRFMWNNQSEPRDQDSNNMELFVQREESPRGSSRFSMGSSLRKIHEKGHHKEEELLIQQAETGAYQEVFHKHNHKILVLDFMSRNRWSNLSSSDLIFLNSEMLNDMSSSRFYCTDWNNKTSSTGKALENEENMKVKQEMEFRKSLHSKVGVTSTSFSSSMMNSGEQGSVSKITSLSIHGDLGVKNKIRESSSLFENNMKEERIRRVGCQLQEEHFNGLPTERKGLNCQRIHQDIP